MDIGKEQEQVEVLPIKAPHETPQPEPATPQHEPVTVPDREKEKVPA